MQARHQEARIYKAVKLGLLEIRPDGSIWKVAEMRGNRWNKKQTFRTIPPHRAENRTGQYLQVRIMIDGERIHCLAHRLVWYHIHGQLAPMKQINHKNGCKSDNRPCNLELITPSENAKHAVRVLRRGKTVHQWGEKNHASKLTNGQIETIRTIYAAGGTTQMQLAIQYQVSHQTISKIVRGDRRSKQIGETADYTHRRHWNPPRNSKGRFTS